MQPTIERAMPDGGPGHIDAYDGPERKAAYLREGTRYLRAVATCLAARGYTETTVRANAGGIAVAGEVTLYAFKPGDAFGVFAEVCQPFGGRSGIFESGGTEPRRDCVSIMYRWTARSVRGMHTDTGPNCWLTPSLRPVDLGDVLWTCALRQNARVRV